MEIRIHNVSPKSLKSFSGYRHLYVIHRHRYTDTHTWWGEREAEVIGQRENSRTDMKTIINTSQQNRTSLYCVPISFMTLKLFLQMRYFIKKIEGKKKKPWLFSKTRCDFLLNMVFFFLKPESQLETETW